MKQALLMLVLAAAVCSCKAPAPLGIIDPTIGKVSSSERCNKKLARLLRKCPDLRTTDTVTIVDTMYVPAEVVYVRDTLRLPGDTIRVKGKRANVRVVREPTGTPCDSVPFPVYVEGECVTDTVYFEKKVPVQGVQGGKCGVARWYRPGFWLLAVLFFLLEVLPRIVKSIKPPFT